MLSFAGKIFEKMVFNRARYSTLFLRLRRFFCYSGRELLLFNAVNFAANPDIPGDYLEFGVYRGESFIQAYHFMQFIANMKRRGNMGKPQMRFFAFDSFEGLSKPTKEEARAKDYAKGDYSCSVEQFKKNLKYSNVGMDKVHITKGWFKDTLKKDIIKKFNMKGAKIIHIDTDLYEPARDALNFCTPLVHDGTIIIFDDWFAYKARHDMGEQKALNEWLDKNRKFRATEFDSVGGDVKSFVINTIQ